jgi:hypothetical protein
LWIDELELTLVLKRVARQAGHPLTKKGVKRGNKVLGAGILKKEI